MSDLSAFCQTTQFAADDANLFGYGPCFEDTVIMGVVHLAFLILVCIRINRLWQNEVAMKMDHSKTHTLKIVCSLLAFLTLFAQFNVVVSAASSAPFQIVAGVAAAVCWLLYTVTLVLERTRYVHDTHWIPRFLAILYAVALAVKTPTVIMLSQVASGREYLTYTHIILGVFVLVLAVVALVHTPSATQRATGTSTIELAAQQRSRSYEQRFQNEDRAEGDSELVDVDENPGQPFPLEDGSKLKPNVFSLLSYSWMNTLFAAGYRRQLDEEDMYALPEQDRGRTIAVKFEAAMRAERKARDASIVRALRSVFGAPFYRAGFIKIFNDLSQFVGPVFLSLLLDFVSTPTQDDYVGYAYALSIFVGMLLGAAAENQYFFMVMRVAQQIRSALITAIYDKAMRLSNRARGERSTGQIVNLMTNDVDRVRETMQNLHLLWSSPLRIIIALVLLNNLLGAATWAGFATMLIMIPLQGRLVKYIAQLRRSVLKTTDTRVKIINEVLGAIQIIKFYAWESSFIKRILDVRSEEIEWLRKIAYTGAVNFLLFNINPILVTVVSFAVYASIPGNALTAGVAFPALALFNVLRYPLIFFPRVISSVVEARVSVERLNDFLLADEQEIDEDDSDVRDRDHFVRIRKGEFTWNSSAGSTLRDIDLDVKQGQLVAVIGQTGCGKSSLVNAILGEMDLVDGVRETCGSIAYVAQQAWIFNATIKDNITFGNGYDSDLYNACIRDCQLTRDLELMAAADLQEIGEKGINLSGGQKQRLSLARAYYRQADIYIFDDPLSALDAHVGKDIFEGCINGALKGKTRVLVTNQIQFVSECDHIVVMKEGSIAEQGTYDELLDRNGEFCRMMAEQGAGEEKDREIAAAEESGDAAAMAAALDTEVVDVPAGEEEEHAATDDLPKTAEDIRRAASARAKNKEQSMLVSKEHRDFGAIDLRVYAAWAISAGGVPFFALLFCSFVLVEGIRVLGTYWVSWWTADTLQLETGVTGYVAGYGGISVAQAVFTAMSAIYLASGGVSAAEHLHEGILKRVLRAPMAFFDSTPLGRLVNRFTKDMTQVDMVLMINVELFLRGLFQIVGTLVVIGISTPYTLIACVPIFTLFFFVQKYFRATAREIKRLDATTRSPIYANFSESLNGVATIRAYRAVRRMLDLNNYHLDGNQRVNLTSMCANRWLSMRLEFLGGLIIMFTGVFAVLQRRSLGPELVGLTLTYAFSITALMNMTVRLFTETENSFNAVERIQEYTDVETEAPPVIEDTEPDADWPQRGEVVFDNVVMKYREDLPPVLKGVSANLQQEEKVGVVGRTGAGKSTLFLTLFRMNELADGKITIDGVDISTLGLDTLRQRLTIIPQDPVLFTGSIRFNLDPFDKHTDAEMWSALERAHLSKVIRALPDKLESQVVEGGDNFSVGQRQLLCMARALLKHTKILVLDEATASVDVSTDALIQKTIREEFAGCTTLTIAHRLNTIIDSDRVLVLDAGKVKEFDTPANLLRNERSEFSSMVNETGETSAQYLRQLAFGEIDLQAELSEQVDEAIEQLDSQAQRAFYFEGELQQNVAGAITTLRKALLNMPNAVWQAELESVGMTQETWSDAFRTMLSDLFGTAESVLGPLSQNSAEADTRFANLYTENFRA